MKSIDPETAELHPTTQSNLSSAEVIEGSRVDSPNTNSKQVTVEGLSKEELFAHIAKALVANDLSAETLPGSTPHHTQVNININIFHGDQVSQDIKIDGSTISNSQLGQAGRDLDQKMKVNDIASSELVDWEEFAHDVKQVMTALVDAKERLEAKIAILRANQQDLAAEQKETQIALFEQAIRLTTELDKIEKSDKTLEDLKADVDDIFAEQYGESFSNQLGEWPGIIAKAFADPKILAALISLASGA